MRAYRTALALMFACGTVGAGMKGPYAALAADGPEGWPAAAEPVQGRMASDTTAGALNPLWAVPLSSLSATPNRPIFSPSRRPPAPPSVPTAGPAPPKPAVVPREADRPPLALVGTIVGESLQIAIVLEETTKQTMRLKTGDDYNGWTLLTVAAGQVEFKGPHQNAVLLLTSTRAATTANTQAATTANSQAATTANAAPIADAPARHRKR